MLKKILTTTVLTVSALGAIVTQAATPGYYVSGQVGYANAHLKSRLITDAGIVLPNDGLAGRIGLGYKISPNAALEVGYLKLSDAKFHFERENATFSNKQYAIDLAAKGMLPITHNVDMYGKVGIAYLTTQLNTPPNEDKEDIAKRTFAPEVAVGMSYDITPNVTVDTSLTHIQTLGSRRPGNIDFLAVGVAYNFG